jgi:superfamily II DNA or RNA helicase
MVLSPRWHSAFSASTLRSLDTAVARTRVREVSFFRNAFEAILVESERRSFTPRFIVDADGGLMQPACSCTEKLLPRDLCRHVAILLDRISHEDGTTTSDRFERSLWKQIGQALFTQHGPASVRHERETGVVRTAVDGRVVVTLRYDDHLGPRVEALHSDDRTLSGRDQQLRRMMLTPNEQELLRRGAASARLRWESSFWYHWSKFIFQQFAQASEFELIYLDAFRLRASVKAATLEIELPAAGVEAVVAIDDGSIAAASGFEVADGMLVPSFRVELTGERALTFTPMLVAARPETIYPRGEAEAFRYGRFFFLSDRRAFATVRPTASLFAERGAGQQSLFGAPSSGSSLGFPWERETIVPEAEVIRFIEKHRDELAAMPAALVPESIREARPVRVSEEVLFDFAPADGELLDVAISFRAFGQTLEVGDIARARKSGLRALNRGSVWLDVTDSQFAWIDALQPEQITAEGRLRISPLEYLRIRGSVRGVAAFRGDATAERVFRMYDDLRAGDAPSPNDLGMDLYGYQQTGYRWLWFLQQHGFGGLLCDDMGLGKTHQAMALIRAMSQSSSASRSFLIVCPTSLIDHWREKLSLYVPDVAFDVHHGSSRELRSGARAIVTSYGVLRSDAERFRGRLFDLMVLDEIQTIKNKETVTHQALRTIDCRVAIGLTGTPVENRIGELKTLLDFVMPDYLPGDAAFDRQYAVPVEANDAEARDRLQQLVRPFVLRRTKAQVLTQLPPKIVDKRYCELTPEQVAMYRKVVESRGQELRAALRGKSKIPYLHVFAALNYLKQICNHPQSVGGQLGRGAGSSGKWELFTELVTESMASGLKVVVFSQYVKMLAIIEDWLNEQQIGFATIKGSTRERGAEIRRFRDVPACRVFTASLRAGGLGIDLTSASVVIHYDRWWNQAREDQATDRVHRMGQSKGVQVLKLITRGTLEEKIDRMIEAKARLASDVVQTDDPTLVKQFTTDELAELLSYD